MDFELVAIALGDVVWISVAFALGLVSRSIGLPPLVGYLITGFLIGSYGIVSGDMLHKLADLGITLLLFTVGLKLNLGTLARPQVWAVSSLHMCATVIGFSLFLIALMLAGLPIVADLSIKSSILIAFALSFSSTVFAVKALEEKGEMKSLHGRLAIGILIFQDIAAVIYLAVSVGKVPSLWAVLLLFLLFPLRPFLIYLLKQAGHGELLVLYGLILSLGGAEIFELAGMKGDLGALVLGVLIANHPKSVEMARTMLGFKDLFLLGFFLSIGLSAQATQNMVILAFVITLCVFIKSLFLFYLLLKFKLRARTAALTTFNLTNYSEFGLIVAAISVSNEWIGSDWLAIIAISISLTFIVAAVLDAFAHKIYARYRQYWNTLQMEARLEDDRVVDTGNVSIALIGMGRVGSGAYEKMRELYGDTVVGIDFDSLTVDRQNQDGRKVLLGDPGDADFWDRVVKTHSIDLMMLALPSLDANLSVIEELDSLEYSGKIAAIARYPDEVEKLQEAGAEAVFNIYTEAGAGFAAHVTSNIRAGL
ncbi:MAG: potassium transporter Kef [Gammaproteobacteria bacterium]|nr:potassium transporter Kef [Gammaproteobacteria bacterium]